MKYKTKILSIQGWNTSWDRFVSESYILHDTEENRLLQKELAETARSILYILNNPLSQFNLINVTISKENRKRRKRIGASLKGAEPKFRTDSDSSSPEDGDLCTISSFNEETPEEDENMESAEHQNLIASESEIIINIPDPIKQFLEDDFINLKYHRKVTEHFF